MVNVPGGIQTYTWPSLGLSQVLSGKALAAGAVGAPFAGTALAGTVIAGTAFAGAGAFDEVRGIAGPGRAGRGHFQTARVTVTSASKPINTRRFGLRASPLDAPSSGRASPRMAAAAASVRSARLWSVQPSRASSHCAIDR